MRCPRCGTDLEARAASVHGCLGCGGVWLSQEQTAIVWRRLDGSRALVDASERIALRAAAERRPPPAEGRVPICPSCARELDLCEAERVLIDVCEAHGTWFDVHELHRIVTAADAPEAASAPVAPPRRESRDWELFDAIGAFFESVDETDRRRRGGGL